jgi:hypothetical protein
VKRREVHIQTREDTVDEDASTEVQYTTYTVKEVIAVFSFPAGMSLKKLSLDANHLII